MSKPWTEGMCNQTSGFLFKHECMQFPQARCGICDKPICEEHTRKFEGKVVCPSCERAEMRKQGNPNDPNRTYYDDPYYHSSTYYYGYGHIGPGYGHSTYIQGAGGRQNDPNDFQSGDAESLKNEGDEGFETDMNES